jgi:hypothetical protein
MGYQDVLACSIVHLAFSFSERKGACGIFLDARTRKKHEQKQYKLMRIIAYHICRLLLQGYHVSDLKHRKDRGAG